MGLPPESCKVGSPLLRPPRKGIQRKRFLGSEPRSPGGVPGPQSAQAAPPPLRGAPSARTAAEPPPDPGPASLTQPEHRGEHRPQPAPAGRGRNQCHGSDGLCHPAPAAPFRPGSRWGRLACLRPHSSGSRLRGQGHLHATAPRSRPQWPTASPLPSSSPRARPAARSLVFLATCERSHWTTRVPVSPSSSKAPPSGPRPWYVCAACPRTVPLQRHCIEPACVAGGGAALLVEGPAPQFS